VEVAPPAKKKTAKKKAAKSPPPKKKPAGKPPKQTQVHNAPEGYAANYQDLSVAVMRSRSALTKYLNRDGAPKKGKEGYNIQEVRDFIEQADKQDVEDGGALALAKLEKIQQETFRMAEMAMLKSFERQVRQGQLMDREEVIRVVCGEMLQEMLAALWRVPIELMDAAGMDRVELRERAEIKIRKALDLLASGKWAQKKTILSQMLSAELSDRLKKSSFGDGRSSTSRTSKTASSPTTTRRTRRSSGPSSKPSGTKKSAK
jgi:hypothetical protein